MNNELRPTPCISRGWASRNTSHGPFRGNRFEHRVREPDSQRRVLSSGLLQRGATLGSRLLMRVTSMKIRTLPTSISKAQDSTSEAISVPDAPASTRSTSPEPPPSRSTPFPSGVRGQAMFLDPTSVKWVLPGSQFGNHGKSGKLDSPRSYPSSPRLSVWPVVSGPSPT